MNHRSSFAVAAIVCVAALAWTLFGGRESQPVAPPLVEGPQRPVGAPSAPSETLMEVGLAPTPDAGPERRAASVAPAEAAPEVHPWQGRLGGLTGRIVEEDGAPVADIQVELMQVDATLMLEPEATALGNTSLELDEARTDADGRFVLEGAAPGGFHLLGIDRGGARSTLRVVEQSLEFDRRVDIGDVVLEGFGVAFGTVVDEDGEPVAGARVRLAAVPDIVTEVGVLDLREDSVIAGGERGQPKAFSIPTLIGAQISKLPIPTTYSGTDGSFRLEGVPLKRVVGGADHPGHVAALIPGFEMKGGEHDLGELELVYGRTLTGRVVDSAGQPIEGAEVVAGAMLALAPAGIMQPASTTDADGRFSVRGVAEVGSVAGFARRNPRDAWVGASAAPGSDALELVLPAAARMTFRVTDGAGAPVRDARFKLTSIESDDMLRGMVSNLLVADRGGAQSFKALSEVEPGVYVAPAVTLGTWLVEVQAPGLLRARKQVAHQSADTLVPVMCGLGQRLALQVVDAVTREPVAAAHATVLAPSSMLLTALASGWTDAAGRADLGPLAPAAEIFEGARDFDGDSGERVIVRVEHPGYGEVCVPFTPGVESLLVPLSAGCVLTGRIHWGGGVPDRAYMVFVTPEGASGMAGAFAVPRLALSALDGTFRLSGLPLGPHDVRVMDRFLQANPLQLIVDQKEPELRYRTDVTLTSGAPVDLDIDLSPNGLGPTGAIAGRVTQDGAPIVGAEVKLGDLTVETDANGEFEATGLSALNGRMVTIQGEVVLPDGTRDRHEVYNDWVQIQPGEVARVDVDLKYSTVEVLVVDASTGAALAGATVSSGGFGNTGTMDAQTGSDGRARVLVNHAAHDAVLASLVGYAPQSASFSPEHGLDGPLRIELRRSVPCAGRVDPSALLGESTAERAWLYLQITGSNGEAQGDQLTKEDDYAFSFSTLGVGQYKAQLYGPSLAAEPIEFELGPNGDEGLVFRFTRKP
ncbi:MAG: carboxypeptidase regulatory-like domain-containing protein [Planctomycetota bacterium]